MDALGPLLDAVTTNTEATPAEVSADSGYCSEANLADLAGRGIRGYVATGRAKHPDGGEVQRRGPLVSAMRRRLRRAGRRSRYRLRKQVVEPVFGQIKQATRLPAVPPPRPREGEARMGADLHRPQPHQARQGGNRMTRSGSGRVMSATHGQPLSARNAVTGTSS